MSRIYIEELDDVDNGEKTVTIFDREDVALAEAGADILTIMRDKWDFTDDSERELAESIQLDIQVSNYRAAIDAFNNAEGNTNCPMYVNVYDKIVSQSASRLKWIDFSEYLPEEEEEEEEEEEDDSPYQASFPGATCRGPCGNPSTDAYADKRDGTFMCYQCKLFSGVFKR